MSPFFSVPSALHVNHPRTGSYPVAAFNTGWVFSAITTPTIMDDDNSVIAPRKVWDVEEAERKYAERLEREKEEAKEAKKKKAAGGKLAPPPSGNANSVQARTEAVIKTEELRGKRELVAPTQGIGNKGRSAGFYCEVCDVTYKDSFSYLDHINSSSRTFFF